MRLEVRVPSPIDAELQNIGGLKDQDAKNIPLVDVSGLNLNLNYYSRKDSPVGSILTVRGADGQLKDRCVIRVNAAGKIKLERRLSTVDPEVEKSGK